MSVNSCCYQMFACMWLYVQLGGVRAVQLCTCTLSVCLAENLRATNVKPKQFSVHVHVVETVLVGDLLTFSASRHSCGLQTSLACQISLLKHLGKDLYSARPFELKALKMAIALRFQPFIRPDSFCVCIINCVPK